MMDSEAQKKATAKYQAANRRRFVVNVNKKTEEDILTWLIAHDNVSGYIKGLVRADYENYKKEVKDIKRRIYGE